MQYGRARVARWLLGLLVPLVQGLLVVGCGPVRAETVALEHVGLELTAEFVAVEAKEALPTVLILHGTMAHHRMEIVQSLQAALKERGISSLAPTLSLGLNRRQGMFDCGVEHGHRSLDAVDEIGAWVAWLKAKGAQRLVMIGHSRGADQVMMYMVQDPDAVIEGVVLLAPPTDGPERLAARYKQATGQELTPIVTEARRLVEDGQEDRLMDLPGFLHCKASRVAAASVLDYYNPEQRWTAMTLLPQLKLRALVIGGSADEVSPDVPGRVAALKLGSNVEVRTIEGADHFFRDLYMDETADLLRGFFGRASR